MSRWPTASNCRCSATPWCRCCRRALSSSAAVYGAGALARAGDRTARRAPRKEALMNRYPLWKYAILVVALLVGLIYTAPNFFGEAPAVQVSSAKATLKLDAGFAPRVQQILEQAGLKPDFVQF